MRRIMPIEPIRRTSTISETANRDLRGDGATERRDNSRARGLGA